MREWMTNILLLSLAIAFLVHLALIAIYGGVVIQEDNALILWLEVAAMVAITALAIYNLVKMIRR